MGLITEQIASLFGFELKKQEPEEVEAMNRPAIAPKIEDDGAIITAAVSGGSYSQLVNFEGSARSEADLIDQYREMANHPEIDAAVSDIVNEMVVCEDNEETVEINLEKVPFPPLVKNAITQEFNEILRLLEFNTRQTDIAKRWYVDGRIYYQVIVDRRAPQAGIQELRYLDPRKIKKIRQVAKTRTPDYPNVSLPVTTSEYFLYLDRPSKSTDSNSLVPTGGVTGMKIAKDSIIYSVSGLTDNRNNLVISHLHKAIKALNCLKSLEDAKVIYCVSRAPERRVFYVDVGTLPKAKAEQLIREVMANHKSKLVYDTETGRIKDSRRFSTMIEDYYLGRREGGRGTQIDTLKGGESIEATDHLRYFQEKLFKSLNVPISRLKPEEAVFSTGRATEITRDEIKFAKFISYLQIKFSDLFLQALQKQVILKQIMSPEEWEIIEPLIRFKFHKDNYFAELKDGEIFAERLARLQAVDPMGPYIGKYFSHGWIRRNILRQSEEEMQEIDQEILLELQNPQYMTMPMPQEDPGGPDSGDAGGPGPDDTGDQYEGEEPPPKKKSTKKKSTRSKKK